MQKLSCCCQDCLSSVSADAVPNAACAVKPGLRYCVQQFEKYLVNLLTSLPKLLIECNTPLTILGKKKKKLLLQVSEKCEHCFTFEA